MTCSTIKGIYIVYWTGILFPQWTINGHYLDYTFNSLINKASYFDPLNESSEVSLEKINSSEKKNQPFYFFAEVPGKKENDTKTIRTFYTYPSRKLFDILKISPDNFDYNNNHSNSTQKSAVYEDHHPVSVSGDYDLSNSYSVAVQPPEQNNLSNGTALYIDSTADREKKFLRSKNPMLAMSRFIFGRPVHPRTLFKWNMWRLKKAIYPYYHKPKLRYPYYDKHGNGELMYGYGEDDLYTYGIFTPLQGYYR